MLLIGYAIDDKTGDSRHDRITLEILKVRVERLQNITEADAIAEGMPQNDPNSIYCEFATHHYATLWDSLHGKGAWELNPWVWVIEFRQT